MPSCQSRRARPHPRSRGQDGRPGVTSGGDGSFQPQDRARRRGSQRFFVPEGTTLVQSRSAPGPSGAGIFWTPFEPRAAGRSHGQPPHFSTTRAASLGVHLVPVGVRILDHGELHLPSMIPVDVPGGGPFGGALTLPAASDTLNSVVPRFSIAVLGLWTLLCGCGGRVEAGQQGQLASGVGGSFGTGGSPGVGGSTATGGSIGAAGSTTVADAQACGVIRASDYDKSCNTAADCTSVFEGNTCTVQCACPNATINQTALAGYHPLLPGGSLTCPCPLLGVPSCVGGVCTMCAPPGCSSDIGTLVPALEAVVGWTTDPTKPVQTAHSFAEATAAVDGTADPFFTPAMSAVGMVHLGYINGTYKIELFVWQMASATDAHTMFLSLPSNPDMLYASVKTPVSPVLGDEGAYGVQATAVHMLIRKGPYLLDLRGSPGLPLAKVTGFATAAIAKLP
jgi:hypothetical protein